jgi:NADPH:quinone reductase-like Zn-dependent oxidoreductase
MKIIRAHEFGSPDMLRIEDVAAPVAGPGQVRIVVKAVGVNPVDWKLLSGKSPILPPLPHVPGGDIAGVIDQVGEGVSGFSVGIEVFALIGLMGGYAASVVVDVASVARKPAQLDFMQAASLPLVALTAWQGFAVDGRELSGLRVLVHNGAGGVGNAAIQIAKARGARVTATASAANADFVRSLGADAVVDFRVTPVTGYGDRFDLMLDCVGNPQANDLWALINKGGSVIRVAGGADAPKEAEASGLRIYKIRVGPNGDQLAEIATLVDSGNMRTEITQIFPFDSATQALRLSMDGHVRGKIVLDPVHF